MAENTTTRLQRIQELKEQLYNTQGEVIKTMEGYPVDDPNIMPKRQLWREQIATLEGMTDAEYEDYTEPEVETYVKDVPSADDIVSQLKELAQAQVADLSDDEAKKVPALFHLWTDHKQGDSIAAGVREWYKGSLYKCITPHNWQSDWAPDVATSLWANVSAGIAGQDPGLLEMARVFGLSRARILRRVTLPSVLPHLEQVAGSVQVAGSMSCRRQQPQSSSASSRTANRQTILFI